MKTHRIATYNLLKNIYTSRDITKKDIIDLCNSVSEKINQPLEPENITEGGILFSDFKGNTGYKSIRFIFNHDWQTFEDLDSWKGSDDVVIKSNMMIQLFIKAFDGAPRWTSLEKNAFIRGLVEIGFVTNKKQLSSVVNKLCR